MRGYSGVNKAGVLFVLAVLLLAIGLPLTAGLIPGPVSAQNAVAISGSFYKQKFVIPVGGSIDVSSVYVVAFNQGTEAATFIVSSSHPTAPDVTIELSEAEFILNPAQSREVQVGVYVGANANPGMHEIAVKVQAQTETTEGVVQPLGSAEQVASLSIVGEAGNVRVETVSPSGGRVQTHIRLWKVIDGEQYEFAESVTGLLEKVVSPGHYIVKAFSMGVELASDEFDVAHLEQVNRTLTVETIYFKSFAATLARNVNTGEPGYAQVVYTIANVYQAVANAQVNLVVKFEGADLELIQGILTLSVLNTGDTGVPYQYFPSAGWEKGTYTFQLELYLGGQLYARSTEADLDVGLPGGRSLLWLWILLGVLGAAGLGFLIFFLVKRRREQEEKPRKAEKKRREEKPAPKAKEPVRKPEPYRPPEPVRPVQPARPLPKEEPIVEPAPLASISSLKARMASMGRDQGTGQPDDEGPGAEEQEKPEETSLQDSVVDVVPPPPRAEPEQPAVPKAQKPPASHKPAAQKPGIFSSVKATPKQEPPKPPSDIQINWPPKSVEPPKPPSDVQINWPPKSVEPRKPPSDVQINWPPKPVEPPEPKIEAAPPAPAPAEEVAGEAPGESQVPPARSSFAEAARLRMEARQHATGPGSTGGAPEESPTEVDSAGEPGEGEERPPTP
ncbi:MAG: hypothetical protein JW753_00355 [Dehalococcoidia bacterium]|nr:hypothetical protein [Dehalococcoidia bacterium]